MILGALASSVLSSSPSIYTLHKYVL